MKKQLLGILLLIFALSVVFLIMSCASGPQNGNVSQNQGQMQSLPTPAPSPSPTPDDDEPNAPECNGTDLETIKTNVQTRLDRSPVARLVKFDVRVVGNTLEVYVQNLPAAGAKRVPRDKTKMLDKELKKVMKGGCVTRVIFVKPGTVVPLTDVRDIEGFEWGCNEPTVLCPNGECREPSQCSIGTIPAATPAATPGSNTSANGNANKGNP